MGSKELRNWRKSVAEAAEKRWDEGALLVPLCEFLLSLVSTLQ